MCCHRERGRLAKRIFGNRSLPEDRLDQFLSDLTFSRGIFRAHELFVCRSQSGTVGGCRFDTPLRQCHQGAAHRQFALLRDPLHHAGKTGRNRHALANRTRYRFCGGFWLARHSPILPPAHHSGAHRLTVSAAEEAPEAAVGFSDITNFSLSMQGIFTCPTRRCLRKPGRAILFPICVAAIFGLFSSDSIGCFSVT